MPANPKYLMQSGWQKFGKISAAIVGAYLVTMSMHLAFASWLNHVAVIATITFSGFIVWVGLMIVTFLAQKVWKIWALYLALSLLFLGIAYLGKMYNPNYMLP